MQEYEKKEKRHGKIMGFVCLGLAILFIILTITAIILGYVVSFKGGDGEMRDGLGRMLDDVPSALSFILPQWAGYIWFIIDCLILLGMIIIIDKLFVQMNIYFKGIKNVDF